MIILVLYVVAVYILLIFKDCIFTALRLDDSSYVGALVGGALGGLGTLITLFITVKDARDAQNKSEEFQRQESERNRKEGFMMEIAKRIGDYEASQAKYFYGSLEIENIENRICKRREITNISENDPLLNRWEDEIKTIRYSDGGIRVAENKDYFVLKTMMGDIGYDSARALIILLDEIHNQEESIVSDFEMKNSDKREWLSGKREELESLYYSLKKEYLSDNG